MATTLNVAIIRAGSPVLNINLVPAHLPTEVRQAFEQLAEKRAALTDAEKRMAGLKGTAWTEADGQRAEAEQAAGTALEDFVRISAASSTAIRDSANATFTACIERASAHIQGALDELAEAGQAAALYASVTPGKPVLRLDTRGAEDSTARKSIGMARSLLQEMRSWVPDSVE